MGVVDVDTFFPSKERFAFAMKLNNLLASPSFAAWLEGEVWISARSLHTARGQTAVAIFSIAHLNDAERMFFVSLFLNQMVVWITESIRDDEPPRAALHG